MQITYGSEKYSTKSKAFIFPKHGKVLVIGDSIYFSAIPYLKCMVYSIGTGMAMSSEHF